MAQAEPTSKGIQQGRSIQDYIIARYSEIQEVRQTKNKIYQQLVEENLTKYATLGKKSQASDQWKRTLPKITAYIEFNKNLKDVREKHKQAAASLDDIKDLLKNDQGRPVLKIIENADPENQEFEEVFLLLNAPRASELTSKQEEEARELHLQSFHNTCVSDRDRNKYPAMYGIVKKYEDIKGFVKDFFSCLAIHAHQVTIVYNGHGRRNGQLDLENEENPPDNSTFLGDIECWWKEVKSEAEAKGENLIFDQHITIIFAQCFGYMYTQHPSQRNFIRVVSLATPCHQKTEYEYELDDNEHVASSKHKQLYVFARQHSSVSNSSDPDDSLSSTTHDETKYMMMGIASLLVKISQESREYNHNNVDQEIDVDGILSGSEQISRAWQPGEVRKFHTDERGGYTSSSSGLDQIVHHRKANQLLTGTPKRDLGNIEFELEYTNDNKELHCRIIRATNLPAMDRNGYYDPYVMVDLLPALGKSFQKCTSRKKKTLNPEWDETLTYKGILKEDIHSRKMIISVFDWDMLKKDDYIGEIQLPLECLEDRKVHRFCEDLAAKQESSVVDTMLVTKDCESGRILIFLKYITERAQLAVYVKCCAYLAINGNKSCPDSYIKLFLRPDVTYGKGQKTEVKKKTANPVFDKEFIFEIKLGDMTWKSLDVEVWNRHLGNDHYIGGIALSTKGKSDCCQHWNKVIDNPDEWHEEWHILEKDDS